MIDDKRLERVHVDTVCMRDNKYYVVLADHKGKNVGEVLWEMWIKMSYDERRNQ